MLTDATELLHITINFPVWYNVELVPLTGLQVEYGDDGCGTHWLPISCVTGGSARQVALGIAGRSQRGGHSSHQPQHQCTCYQEPVEATGPACLAVQPLDLHVVHVGSIPTGPTHGEGRLQPHPGDVLKSTPNVRKSPRSDLNLEGRLSDPQIFLEARRSNCSFRTYGFPWLLFA